MNDYPPALALIDGKSFYCSCEPVLNAKLEWGPVIELSNNGGRAVARTSEAKALAQRSLSMTVDIPEATNDRLQYIKAKDSPPGRGQSSLSGFRYFKAGIITQDKDRPVPPTDVRDLVRDGTFATRWDELPVGR